MNPPNSSISNSDLRMQAGWRDCAVVSIWTIVTLIIIDLSLVLVSELPSGPTAHLKMYIDVGLPIETKVDRLLRHPGDEYPSIVRAGFPTEWKDRPTDPHSTHAPLVAFYGMSFTNRIGRALHRNDPRLTIRYIDGPSAPLNHSYDAFQQDLQYENIRVAVLGIYTRDLTKLHTSTGMTRGFVNPMPYCYPQFQIRESSLHRIDAPIHSPDELDQTFSTNASLEHLKDFLQENDLYYDPFLFNRHPLDHSSIFRLLRRLQGGRHVRSVDQQIMSDDGRLIDADIEEISSILIKRFALQARRHNRVPIILILTARGHKPYFLEAVRPTLHAENIRYIHSGDLASPHNPNNYIPDGHFQPHVDRAIATELLKLIDEALPEYTAPIPDSDSTDVGLGGAGRSDD